MRACARWRPAAWALPADRRDDLELALAKLPGEPAVITQRSEHVVGSGGDIERHGVEEHRLLLHAHSQVGRVGERRGCVGRWRRVHCSPVGRPHRAETCPLPVRGRCLHETRSIPRESVSETRFGPAGAGTRRKDASRLVLDRLNARYAIRTPARGHVRPGGGHRRGYRRRHDRARAATGGAGRRRSWRRGGSVAGATGYTTAKVTGWAAGCPTRLQRVAGREVARAYAGAQLEGLQTIIRLVDELDVDRDLERAPNYVFAEADAERELLLVELDAARESGLASTLEERPDAAFAAVAALRLDDQAQLHPRKYLQALATAFVDAGGTVLERTRVTDIVRGSPACGHRLGKLLAGKVVVATRVPIGVDGSVLANLEPRRSYVIAAPIDDTARPPPGMWINVATPTRSVRTAPGDGSRLVMVGEGHVVGREGPPTARRARAVPHRADRLRRDHTSMVDVQDLYLLDGLPLAGRVVAAGTPRSSSRRDLVDGGMTNRTVAAQLLADLVVGVLNRWTGLYDPGRLKGQGRFSVRLHGRRCSSHAARTAGGVGHLADRARLGEGCVVAVDGRDIAVSRSAAGTLRAVSAVCTHMGCLVGWNDAEGSWDCPCHGSRFNVDGEVLEGPATTPLEQIETRLPVYRSGLWQYLERERRH